jgi:hypothetical protein
MTPYYTILNVLDLYVISREIDAVVDQLVTGPADLKEVYTFNIIDTTRLLELVPSLANWLDAVGLKNHLLYAGLPCIAPYSAGNIHTDAKCSESINFPVYNCDSGYSAWYNAKPKGDITENTSGKSTDQSAEYIPHKNEGAVELARVSNKYPIWFNNSIPHNGINTSHQPRIILTMRFDCPIDVDALALEVVSY